MGPDPMPFMFEDGPAIVFVVTFAGVAACMVIGTFFAIGEWLYHLWKGSKKQGDRR